MALKHRLEGIESIKIVENLTINFKNEPFVLDDLYKVLHEWLVEENWEGPRGSIADDANFPEDYYLQRVNPQLGREIWWRWRLQKNPLPMPKTKFWRFLLDIDVHALWIKQVEVAVKDQKVKADKGEIEFQISAYVAYDFDKTWEKTAWLKPFKQMWINRIKLSEKNMLANEMNTQVVRLQELIKNFFGLQLYLSEKEFEGFYPKKMPT